MWWVVSGNAKRPCCDLLIDGVCLWNSTLVNSCLEGRRDQVAHELVTRELDPPLTLDFRSELSDKFASMDKRIRNPIALISKVRSIHPLTSLKVEMV